MSKFNTCQNCKHSNGNGICAKPIGLEFPRCWEEQDKSTASTKYQVESSQIVQICDIAPTTIIHGPIVTIQPGSYVEVYQVEYSRGSYEDFSCWVGENIYFRKEDAEKELADFLKENSLENLKKKFKITDYEYWKNDCFNSQNDILELKKKHPEMSDEEIENAYREDCQLYYGNLCDSTQYNYELCKVVERKLR